MNEEKLYNLRADMIACEQTKNLSVLSHGYSVNSYFWDLINHLYYHKELKYEWKLPDWVYDKNILFKILDTDSDIIENYLIYHDCGKPYCLEIDSEGKKHFPDHSNKSAQIWKDIGGNSLECELMKRDMDIHLLKDKGIDEFMKFEHWPILLFAGLSEVHSNAAMFGGVDSTSFKIKWKQINKRGKAILKKLEKKS